MNCKTRLVEEVDLQSRGRGKREENLLSQQETTPVVYDTVVPFRLTLYRRVLRARTLVHVLYQSMHTVCHTHTLINYFIMHTRSTMHILVILYELVILQQYSTLVVCILLFCIIIIIRERVLQSGIIIKYKERTTRVLLQSTTTTQQELVLVVVVLASMHTSIHIMHNSYGQYSTSSYYSQSNIPTSCTLASTHLRARTIVLILYNIRVLVVYYQLVEYIMHTNSQYQLVIGRTDRMQDMFQRPLTPPRVT